MASLGTSGLEPGASEVVLGVKRPRQENSDVTNPKWALSPSARIITRKLSPLPYGMHQAQTVKIGDIIYIGGGITNAEDGVNLLVFKYNCAYNVWCTLPPCPVTHFGLAAVNQCPVTFGGKLTSNGGKMTQQCFTFHEQSNEWKETLPPMPTKCSEVRSISNEQCVVCVAKDVATMVYNIIEGKWNSVATGLKPTCSVLQPVMIDKLCFCCSKDGRTLYTIQFLDDLVMRSDDDLYRNGPTNYYAYHISSLMASGGSLFSIGTVAVNKKSQTETVKKGTLFVYNSLGKAWIPWVRGFLQPAIEYPACVALSDGSILVIGGRNEQGRSSNEVTKIEFASINFNSETAK